MVILVPSIPTNQMKIHTSGYIYIYIYIYIYYFLRHAAPIGYASWDSHLAFTQVIEAVLTICQAVLKVKTHKLSLSVSPSTSIYYPSAVTLSQGWSNIGLWVSIQVHRTADRPLTL